MPVFTVLYGVSCTVLYKIFRTSNTESSPHVVRLQYNMVQLTALWKLPVLRVWDLQVTIVLDQSCQDRRRRRCPSSVLQTVGLAGDGKGELSDDRLTASSSTESRDPLRSTKSQTDHVEANSSYRHPVSIIYFMFICPRPSPPCHCLHGP